MNLLYRFLLLLLFTGTLVSSCIDETKLEKIPLMAEIDEIREEYAPDKRVALFSIAATKQRDTYILNGESNVPNAVEALKKNLKEKNLAFVDSITMLPNADLEGKTKGIVTISVANIRSNAKHSAELATQATLGTPVNVLKREEDWFLIQTPDKYISWVDFGAITVLNHEAYLQWKKAPKIIFTNTTGYVYSIANKQSQILSDVVAGGIMEFLGEEKEFYKVGFPDGRKGFVLKTQAMDYGNWISTVNPTGENLVTTSKKFMGLPYLWGGTSTKGVDCSGFTKSIYFLNGMVIPRDASQQVHTGKEIDSVSNFNTLQKGDLLFFGRKKTDSTKERVVHVGMWIGNKEFIHASGTGRVQIGSTDSSAANYDAYNVDRYLRSKRLLKEEDPALVNLVNTPIFKD
ncbi:SH3 domain-containing C40 family peptidase [uncultured Maribacter sp.]|uniref:C40 family peptidase n=1 Tax=uncultured Maribacter sp. TaxID=431308 RepID=UPI00260E65FB|nr:SH3 domain-containing C40 family peptidase [uncultured Maribacter sp.]